MKDNKNAVKSQQLEISALHQSPFAAGFFR